MSCLPWSGEMSGKLDFSFAVQWLIIVMHWQTITSLIFQKAQTSTFSCPSLTSRTFPKPACSQAHPAYTQVIYWVPSTFRCTLMLGAQRIHRRYYAFSMCNIHVGTQYRQWRMWWRMLQLLHFVVYLIGVPWYVYLIGSTVQNPLQRGAWIYFQCNIVTTHNTQYLSQPSSSATSLCSCSHGHHVQPGPTLVKWSIFLPSGCDQDVILCCGTACLSEVSNSFKHLTSPNLT